MKYKFTFTKKFKKDYKKISQIVPSKEIDDVINKLLNGETLDKKYHDHSLSGNYKGCRDCHIRSDLVLIYRKGEDILLLTALRLGSHSEVF